jgi:hypothetical protein
MLHRTLLFGSLALAALLLTGCSTLIPDPGQIVEDTVGGVVEDTIEGATGADVNTGTLPSDWPGLPTPDGQLISSVAADGTYVLDYLLDDVSAIDAVKESLIAQGFEVTVESLGELNVVQLVDPEWTVSFTWYELEDGIGLNYSASPTPS